MEYFLADWTLVSVADVCLFLHCFYSRSSSVRNLYTRLQRASGKIGNAPCESQRPWNPRPRKQTNCQSSHLQHISLRDCSYINMNLELHFDLERTQQGHDEDRILFCGMHDCQMKQHRGTTKEDQRTYPVAQIVGVQYGPRQPWWQKLGVIYQHRPPFDPALHVAHI